jgi:2'-5' RNA ligase
MPVEVYFYFFDKGVWSMRVFAGLPLPPEIIEKLKKVGEVLKSEYRGVRTVGPEGLHITLFFFGELQETKVNELIELMDEKVLVRKRIQTTFGSIGQFPKKGNPRVIYISVVEGSEEIISFYKTYYNLIRLKGFRDPDESKDYIPHITLARNKRERIERGFLESLPRVTDDFTIDRCVLFKSVLKSTGAEYTPLKTLMFT